MEKEIIKTEYPNIIIERTITDTQLDIDILKNQKEGFENLFLELESKKAFLESQTDLPEIVKEVVDKEIANIIGDIFTYKSEVERLNRILNA